MHKYWVALRPFSFPASLMPVLFGNLLPWSLQDVPVARLAFIVSLIAMMLLHGAANVLNDVYDYRKGLDTTVFPASGAVVRGFLSPREAMWYASLVGAAGCVLGVCLALAVTLKILMIGLIGVGIGILYSVSSVGLKYRGLGDLSVFLNFGVLGALGAWTLQSGEYSWIPVIWAVPFSLLVVAILHANNWRDIVGDSSKGFCTVASALGERGSLLYYRLLLIAPYVIVAALVCMGVSGSKVGMPPGFLLTWLSLPFASRLLSPSRDDLIALDGRTAQLNLIFGLLMVGALLVHRLV